MTYNVIATGSDGNATVINDCILIDCGVPYKALKHYVKRLQLVLLTHEHSDHFNAATVRRLAQERPGLRWGCCEWMVEKLLDAGIYRRQIDVYEPGKSYGYRVAAMKLSPVETPLNVRNCAYKIVFTVGGLRSTQMERLFYATDCGTLDGITAKGFDVYMVEANHKQADIERRAAEKLAAGEYAYEFKAADNHLSFEQARDWLAENMGPRSIWVPMHEHKGRPNDESCIADGPVD